MNNENGIDDVNDLKVENKPQNLIQKVVKEYDTQYAYEPVECLIQRCQGLAPGSRAKEIRRIPNSVSLGSKGVYSRNRRWRCRPVSKQKKIEVCRPQLEGPLGMLSAVFNIDTFTEIYNKSNPIDLSLEMIRPFVALSTCYAAFGFSYITPESEWTEIAMNEVLNYGQKIFRDSLQKCETLESPKFQVTKKCILCKNAMLIQLSAPIIVGTLQCKSSRTYSITVGLEMFMEKYAYCICEIHDYFFLIWQRSNCFFLFDCYGRNLSCNREFKTGNAALICVCDVKNIGLILQHMSDFDSEVVYSLYALQMKGLIPCCDEDLQIEIETRKADYKLLGNEHAVLKGNLHIGHERFRGSLQKQGLPTVLAAILYSKIDPSCTWDANVLDKILSKGDTLYQALSNHNPENCVAVQDIPANLPFGQFVVSIEIIPRVLETTWNSIDMCKTNAALIGIKKLFENDRAKSLILQADTRIYAAWKRNNFYYIFDPYQRTIINATYMGPEKHSTLHLVDCVDRLCAIINEYVIRAPIPSHFYIHVVKVVNIQKMNIENLPAHERAISSVIPAFRRNSLKTKDEYWGSGFQESRDRQHEYTAMEDIQYFDREEITSLNESVYDLECAGKSGGQYEFYNTAEDELDGPVYSDRQISPREPNVIVEDSVSDASDDIWSDPDWSQQKSASASELTIDKWSFIPEADQKGGESDEIKESKKSKESKKNKKIGKSKEERNRVSIGGDQKKPKNPKRKKGGTNVDQESSSHEESEDNEKTNKSKDRSRNKKKGHEKRDNKKTDNYSKKNKSRNKSREGYNREDKHISDDETDENEEREKKTRKKYDHKGKDKIHKEKKKIKEGDIKKGARKNKSFEKKGKKDLATDEHYFEESESNDDFRETDTHQNVASWDSKIKDKDQMRKSSDSDISDKSEASTFKREESSHQTIIITESQSDSKKDSLGSESKTYESLNSTNLQNDRSNNYPGYRPIPYNMAVIGSENGSYKSLCSLISSGLKVTDRILAMTPWGCRPVSKQKKIEVCRPQLEGPLGMLSAVFNIDTFTEIYNKSNPIDLSLEMIRPFVALSTCYAAFGFSYITPESEWTEIAMNEVLNYGQKIFRDSLQKCETLESPKFQVTKKCILCKNAMLIQLSAPIIVGTLQCKSSRTYSITVGLEMFMEKYAYCICEIHDYFFLIWQRSNCFFLFDCYGRNLSCNREFKTGNAALICVCDVKNIGLILQHMSDFDSEVVYSLYALQMKGLIPCCDEDLQIEIETRKADYKLLGNEHAVLKGNLHIGHERFRGSLQKQGLPTVLAAILYSKIDPSCTWDANVLDKILSKGDTLYQALSNHNPENCVAVQDIPANLPFGQFVVSIEIIPRVLETTWNSIDMCKTNAALIGIKKLFENDRAKSLILQADTRIYAAWKRNNFYYIFDPYQRTIINATYMGPEKHSTLHLVDCVDRLCAIINEYVIRAPIPSHFYIHVVKVVNIQKMNIENLPAHERAISSVIPAFRRNSLKTKDEYWGSGFQESRDRQHEYTAKEDIQYFDREEITSLNESVYDLECAGKSGGQYEFYNTAEDELDGPVYSDRQISPREPNVIVEDSVSDASDDIWSDPDWSQQKSASASELTIDKWSFIPEADQKGGESDEIKESKKSKESKKNKKIGKSKEERNRVSIGGDQKKPKNPKRKKGGTNVDQESSSHEESEDNEKTNKSKDRSRNKKKGYEKRDNKKTDNYSKKNKSRNKSREGYNREDKHISDDETDENEEREKKTRKKYDHKGKDKIHKEKKKIKEGDIKKGARKNKSFEKKGKKDLATDEHYFEEGESNDDFRETDTHQDVASWDSKIKDKDQMRKSSDSDISDKSEASTFKREESSHQTIIITESQSDSKKDSLGSESKTYESLNSTNLQNDRSNNYPGYRPIPYNMAVIGSENGSYKSLCSLISSGLKVTDRILAMTPWGNYVIFMVRSSYFLFDGCTCNPQRFRHLDLNKGTAGLLSCTSLHELILRIMKGKQDLLPQRQKRTLNVDDICREFCR